MSTDHRPTELALSIPFRGIDGQVLLKSPLVLLGVLGEDCWILGYACDESGFLGLASPVWVDRDPCDFIACQHSNISCF